MERAILTKHCNIHIDVRHSASTEDLAVILHKNALISTHAQSFLGPGLKGLFP